MSKEQEEFESASLALSDDPEINEAAFSELQRLSAVSIVEKQQLLLSALRDDVLALRLSGGNQTAINERLAQYRSEVDGIGSGLTREESALAVTEFVNRRKAGALADQYRQEMLDPNIRGNAKAVEGIKIKYRRAGLDTDHVRLFGGKRA